MVTRGSKSQTIDTLPSNSDHQFHVQAKDDNRTQTPKMSLYEQSREQRIKENFQRMQQLGLKDLSNSLLNFSSHPSSRLGRPNKGSKSAATPLAHSLSPSAPVRRSSRLSVNKKPAAKGGRKSVKAAEDQNKPKRPASTFFVFMEEFRKQFKKDHPKNKSVAAVGKAGGDKWKSLSEAEKAPYVAKAEKRKVEYEKNMKAYNKRQAEGPKGDDEEESDKSVSEVNDDDDDDEEGSGEDPNKPKRPAGTFFVFMEEFREQFKKDHPENKSVAAVGKAGGDKWKSLSEAEKAPYIAKAEKRKVEYEKNMKAYNKRQAEGPKGDDEEESDKSVLQVNDDDDEEGSGEEEDDE